MASMVETAQRLERGGFAEQPHALSADYVIAFAKLRLDHVEGNLSSLMKQMNATQKDSAAINAFKQWLNDRPKGFASDAELKAAYDKIDDIVRSLPPNSPVRGYLLDLKDNTKSLLNRTEGDGVKDNCVTEGEITQLQAGLDLLMRDIDRSSSTGQLYANKYLGEQSQILQLAAQMLQSFNETAKAILGRG